MNEIVLQLALLHVGIFSEHILEDLSPENYISSVPVWIVATTFSLDSLLSFLEPTAFPPFTSHCIALKDGVEHSIPCHPSAF